MTQITSVSQTELASRRQQLQQARRLKIIQTLWRTLAISGITGGVVWIITLPGWVISQPEQVAIAGNKLLASQTVRKLLPINYPQSLFRLEPQSLAIALESTGPIAKAKVSRQVFPPRLTVEVIEREPVAIAVPRKTTRLTPNTPPESIGLLDIQGIWMPLENYNTLDPAALPSLKLIGARENYLPYWSQLYPPLHQSTVKITEVDWQNPKNIILHTELGMVHCGSFSPQFAKQLKTLDRMRQLPKQINPSQIAYIDLKNPDAPSIQFK